MPNQQTLVQFAFLTSIFTGFAFAITIQLIALKDTRSIVSAALSVIIASAMLFLVATWVYSTLANTVTNSQAPYSQEAISKVSDVRSLNAQVTAIATILLFCGIALSGWIHSKRVGFFTTATVVIAFALSLMMLARLQ